MRVILFPQSDANVTAATVVRWLRQPGDMISAGEGLVELELEAGLLVVEAAGPGRLGEHFVEAGQTIAAGAELAGVETDSTAAVNAPIPETFVAEPSSLTSGSKAIPVLMPQAGNTMEEGTVIAWRVKEGDRVTLGQILCEIETDKATMDFESPEAGRLARIVAPVGEPVAVKQPIAILAEADADADAYLAGRSMSPSETPVAEPSTAVPQSGPGTRRFVAPAAVTAEGRVKASPAARRIAVERGIELETIGIGSGPGGRILSSDLENGVAVVGVIESGPTGEIRRPLSKMRRAIGLNLQQSKQTVPHFYVRITIDADPLLAFYGEQKSNSVCTLNDILVLALGRVMREFPAVRSQIVGNEIIEYPHANIGIAVGVNDGLVVPVVTDVDIMPLAKLAAETKRVVDQARKGRLDNVGKGHFTISNLGMFGVEEFSAIINPPESGILAVSAAREAVIVENGAMRAGRTMTMTLSADHRIVDGVMAAKFMQRLKDLLEHPGEELS